MANKNKWNKYPDTKPLTADKYFVCTKNSQEAVILDYDVKHDDFGIDFTYGQWESYTSDKTEITHWMKIEYPTVPNKK